MARPAAGMEAGVVVLPSPLIVPAAREDAVWRSRLGASTDVEVGQEAAHNDMILHVCTGRKGMIVYSKRASERLPAGLYVTENAEMGVSPV